LRALSKGGDRAVRHRRLGRRYLRGAQALVEVGADDLAVVQDVGVFDPARALREDGEIEQLSLGVGKKMRGVLGGWGRCRLRGGGGGGAPCEQRRLKEDEAAGVHGKLLIVGFSRPDLFDPDIDMQHGRVIA
jgi:hypothetical protein